MNDIDEPFTLTEPTPQVRLEIESLVSQFPQFDARRIQAYLAFEGVHVPYDEIRTVLDSM